MSGSGIVFPRPRLSSLGSRRLSFTSSKVSSLLWGSTGETRLFQENHKHRKEKKKKRQRKSARHKAICCLNQGPIPLPQSQFRVDRENFREHDVETTDPFLTNLRQLKFRSVISGTMAGSGRCTPHLLHITMTGNAVEACFASQNLNMYKCLAGLRKN